MRIEPQMVRELKEKFEILKAVQGKRLAENEAIHRAKAITAKKEQQPATQKRDAAERTSQDKKNGK